MSIYNIQEMMFIKASENEVANERIKIFNTMDKIVVDCKDGQNLFRRTFNFDEFMKLMKENKQFETFDAWTAS